jgi:primosomal protein N'
MSSILFVVPWMFAEVAAASHVDGQHQMPQRNAEFLSPHSVPRLSKFRVSHYNPSNVLEIARLSTEMLPAVPCSNDDRRGPAGKSCQQTHHSYTHTMLVVFQKHSQHEYQAQLHGHSGKSIFEDENVTS